MSIDEERRHQELLAALAKVVVAVNNIEKLLHAIHQDIDVRA